MSSQRYQRVAADDEEQQHSNPSPPAIPNSPPPSFRSRTSSRLTSHGDTHDNAEDSDLDNAFDAPSDDEDEDDDSLVGHGQDQQLLISRRAAPPAGSDDSSSAAGSAHRPIEPERRNTEIPAFQHATQSGRVVGGSSQANDGVWANLNAKPRAGEDTDEEKPPTYEQAAADATPPYWETTVLSPYGHSGNPDDVFVDGLLVGSLFSFIWNALISMSFQLIGFLLTYLLHTTHAAKHGSRTGLGITLIQYGFQMRYAASVRNGGPGVPPSGPPVDGIPDDPNAHDFNPNQVSGGGDSSPPHGLSGADWLSYGLMIVGWFILIRAVSDFTRARRQEALVRSSPDRGLGVAVVAQNETPEDSV